MKRPTFNSNSPDAVTLETLVDRYGLAQVLAVLATTCEGKSDHIGTHWQDRYESRRWGLAARLIDRTVAAPAVQLVSQ